MKKQYIYLVMYVLLYGFTSCSQDDENDLVQTSVEVNFNIGISQTRTVTSGKITSFVEGDQIGIFGKERGEDKLLNKNVQYTYDRGNKWTAIKSITFPITGESVDFYAYYPFGNTESTTFDFTISADQSADDGYAKSDLLMAKNESATVGDLSITLNFVRPMAMVEVRPILSDDSHFELHRVELTAMRTASIDLIRQTATVKTETVAEGVNLMKVAEGIYRAVVPVQTLNGKILKFSGKDKNTNLSDYYEFSVVEAKLSANKITVFKVNL